MSQAIKCLLIDDDIDDQEIFKIALEEVEVAVDCTMVNDGVRAISLLKTAPDFLPDIIFLDLNMPRMTGLECLENIRKLPELQDTPVIIMTNSRASRDRDETIRMGGTHFYSKPSGVSELSLALNAFFKGNFD